MNLILKLLAGMLVGALLGLFAPADVVRGLLTFKALFGQFLNFVIPLIILFYIMSGIASLERNSGRLLGLTVGLAYLSTILAGGFAFAVAHEVLPGLIAEGIHAAARHEQALEPFFTVDIKPLFDVMTALGLAFIGGIGISATGATSLRRVADEGRNIVEWVLASALIPLLPFYIAGVFAGMAADGTVFDTLKTFGVVLLLAVLLHWVWLAVLYTVAGTATGRNPLRLLRIMLPAYLTALGTMSSAATIPVTLRQARAMPVRDEIGDFVIPLCATIHLCGSTITLVSCATAVMMMTAGLDVASWSTMLPFILMLGVAMVAAPGVPGGGVMAALGLLASMLGFGDASLALMIALYVAQDSFGTACNVTGDGAIAVAVDAAVPAAVAVGDEA